MLGFCKDDVKYLMNEIEIDEKTQGKLLPIIKKYFKFKNSNISFSDLIF